MSREQYAEVLAAVVVAHPPARLHGLGDLCACGWTGHPHYAHVAAHVADALAAALSDPEQAVREALDKVAQRLRALKRVGDPSTHETVVQMALTFVREARP